tara:strand:- start:151 stop:450 length:300 start_codon:yes stop_codon:yes gene_type:complete
VRLLFSPAAIADIDAIWNYTAERWGTAQAAVYIRQIGESCDRLATGNLPGVDGGDIRPGYRKQLSGRHMIWYRLTTDSDLEVVRILHQAMDATTGLDDR